MTDWTPGITIRTCDYETFLYYKVQHEVGHAIKVLGMTVVVRSITMEMPRPSPLGATPRYTIELQQVYKATGEPPCT